MFYVPVTTDYWKLPTVNYVPVYSTISNRTSTEYSTSKLNNDLTNVRKQLADLREEFNDLRFEKETCRLCSSSIVLKQCDETCIICYPYIRPREETYSRPASPVHYCSICHDYVIGQVLPPLSPCSYLRSAYNLAAVSNDRLSEYLSRQLDLQRLRQRYIPEERPIWIPTAYKHDYPHRRCITRHAHFSEP